MNIIDRARRGAGKPREMRRWAGTVLPLALAFLVLLGSVAYASVWTDEEDYAPGSVVTISGDNGNGAGYLAGEAVAVEVFGPNGFTASCDGVADEAGAWTCQITLWADERAVGDYTYTATGQTSGVSEDGVFSDSHGTHNFSFETLNLPAGVSITISGSRINPGHNSAAYSVTFISPGPSANTGAQAGGGTSTVSYSGFPASVPVGGQTCALVATSPASGFATGAANGTTTVTGTYSCTSTDTDAPTASPAQSPPANNNGWNNTDVTVQWNWADNMGGTGIDTNNCTTTSASSGEGAAITLAASCKDNAGNTGNASYTVKVDKTAPTASASAAPAPNGHGWNNTDVTVSFSGTDALSGIGSCSSPVVLSSEGANKSASGSCTDLAGNSSAPATASGINIDKTAPTLSPSVSPNPVVLGGSATASPGATDETGGSGIDSASCDAPDTSGVGSKSVSCTATDKAGNTATAAAAYSVIYNFTGFFRPVDMLPTWNKVKAGSAIPVKFSLGGYQGMSILLAGFPVSGTTACYAPGAAVDLIEETVNAGGSSLSYDAASGQYNYVWKTDKAWAGGCRKLTVKLADGTSQVAYFHFTK